MRWCCPAGHGCNGQGDDEPCALDVCRANADELPDAALAVKRWEEFDRAWQRRPSDREPRFRRRAYERARDRALIVIALQSGEIPPSRKRRGDGARARMGSLGRRRRTGRPRAPTS
jgi:hypothetical protein